MTPEESARYWAAKKAQHQRALDFMAKVKAGETYRIERYAVDPVAVMEPYEISRYKDVREKRTITIYAVNKKPGALWFTTTKGEAIDAESLIKWERVAKHLDVFAD
jgi:hypothetical protein